MQPAPAPLPQSTYSAPAPQPLPQSSYSAPSPTSRPVIQNTYSAPAPAPISVVQNTYSAPAPRPVVQNTYSAPAPRPVVQNTYSAPAPRPVIQNSYSAPSPKPAPQSSYSAPSPRPSIQTSYAAPVPSVSTIRPQSSYSAPSSRPVVQSSYSAPSPRPSPRPSYSAPSASPATQLTYSVPSQRPAVQNSYSAPAPKLKPSASYSAPSPKPQNTYSAPSSGQSFSSSISVPSPVFSNSIPQASPIPKAPSSSYSVQNLSPKPVPAQSYSAPAQAQSYSAPVPKPSQTYISPSSSRPAQTYSSQAIKTVPAPVVPKSQSYTAPAPLATPVKNSYSSPSSPVYSLPTSSGDNSYKNHTMYSSQTVKEVVPGDLNPDVSSSFILGSDFDSLDTGGSFLNSQSVNNSKRSFLPYAVQLPKESSPIFVKNGTTIYEKYTYPPYDPPSTSSSFVLEEQYGSDNLIPPSLSADSLQIPENNYLHGNETISSNIDSFLFSGRKSSISNNLFSKSTKPLFPKSWARSSKYFNHDYKAKFLFEKPHLKIIKKSSKPKAPPSTYTPPFLKSGVYFGPRTDIIPVHSLIYV